MDNFVESASFLTQSDPRQKKNKQGVGRTVLLGLQQVKRTNGPSYSTGCGVPIEDLQYNNEDGLTLSHVTAISYT